MATEQLALYLDKVGGDWDIRKRDIPKPGEDELLVKILSSALNPVDYKLRFFDFIGLQFPAIFGIEASGEVEEVGKNVTNFKKGDKVFFQGFFQNDQATYQQYTLISADIAGKVPKGLSLDDAATVPTGAFTAVVGLYSKEFDRPEFFQPPWVEGAAGKYKGTPILILGGSSTVGQYAIQFAKLSGFSPIIVTASPRNFSYLRELGATHPIDRSSDVSAEVSKIVGDAPIKFVFDTISTEETQSLGWEILSPGGQITLTHPPSVDLAKYPTKKAFFLSANSRVPSVRKLAQEMYSQLPDLIASGAIKATPYEVIPGGLRSVSTGLDRLMRGEVSAKKLIVHPQESL